MNPLTQVKNTQKITAREAALGVSEAGSWHAKYKDSAYVYAGNFSFDLTEGDLLAIFAQYGEIVDINLVRDKGTGKSRGFAFLAYEDQRSTVLAVDNLNGASVVGRTIKVDHVANYKKKAEEDEEEEQRKREERGVCRAFQRGDCNRGAACKFSHDEKRSANTGWGSKDDAAKWTHDKYDRASQQEQGRWSRDESGTRTDGGSRSKGREEQGRKGDAGSKLQEMERLERNSGASVHSTGYTSKDTRNQHGDDRRGSERRDHGQHRGDTDRKVRRDGPNDNTELRNSDDERRDEDRRKNQREQRIRSEKQSEDRDHRQHRERDTGGKGRSSDDMEHGRRDDESRGQDHRKKRRDERGYDIRHNGGDDYSVSRRGRREEEELQRSKTRRHDSDGESSEDRVQSRPSRRSRLDTGAR